MKIKSVSIHEIIKESNTTEASLFLSNETLSTNNKNIINIVKTLDKSFGKKTIKRAKFYESRFVKEFNNFKNYNILNSSKVLTEKLKDNIQGISAAKGGYLVFVEYSNNHNFLSVFLVRNTDGNKLIQSGVSWDINSTQYLDTEHFAMGVKINLTLIENKSEERYISLVRGKQDISKYFETWVGIDDIKQENTDAKALYKISNNIETPNNVTRDELKKKIFDYAKNHPSKTINIRELSAYLYDGNENKIPEYCQQHEIDIDGEFKLTGNNLQKFYKIHAKADEIELTAPRSKFNNDIIQITNDAVIIRSKDLIDQLNENM